MSFFWFLLFFLTIYVSWKKPIYAALPIIAALPAYLFRTAVFGFPTTLLEAVLLGSACGYYAELLMRRRTDNDVRNDARKNPFFWPALALLTIATGAVFIAPDTRAALGVWRAYFLEPILLLPLFVTTLKDARARAWTFRLFAAEVMCLAIVAVLQKIGVFTIIEPWTLERRATSIYPFPNALGLFVGPLIPFFAALAAHETKQTRDRWLFACASIAGFVAILLSKTDGAIGAAMFALLILGFVSTRRIRRMTLLVACAGLLAIVAVQPIRTKVVETLTLQDWSGTVRRVMWQETVEMLKTRPLLGAGLSGYKTAIAPFHKDPKVEIFQYPHTLLLNVWTELGALGILVWIWILIVFLKLLRHKKEHALHHHHLAAALAVLTLLIHGLVDVPYFKNDLAILTWFLLLLGTAPSDGHRSPLVVS
jgi:O-antigen ligase